MHILICIDMLWLYIKCERCKYYSKCLFQSKSIISISWCRLQPIVCLTHDTLNLKCSKLGLGLGIISISIFRSYWILLEIHFIAATPYFIDLGSNCEPWNPHGIGWDSRANLIKRKGMYTWCVLDAHVKRAEHHPNSWVHCPSWTLIVANFRSLGLKIWFFGIHFDSNLDAFLVIPFRWNGNLHSMMLLLLWRVMSSFELTGGNLKWTGANHCKKHS